MRLGDDSSPVVRDGSHMMFPSAGLAGAVGFLGEVSEEAVAAPSEWK